MGIRGLNKAIKQYAAKSMKEKLLKSYKGKKIAIDSEILIYKYRSQAYKQTEHNPDDFHLHAFTNNVANYLNNGIIPIYIFDGRPPVAKQNNVLLKRYEERTKVQSQVAELENKFVEQCSINSNEKGYNSYLANKETLELLDLLLKTQNRCTIVTKQHRQECKYLLKLLGVPIISSDGEAEALCVKLAVNNLVDYVFTEDSDAVTYAIGLSKSLSATNGGNNEKYVNILKKGSHFTKFLEINTEKVLKEFNFTQNQFIDFCILSGCDYCPTIPKIGPITSYKMIKEHKNIENCLKHIKKKYTVPDNFNFQEAREIFKNPPVNLPSSSDFEFHEPDFENLKKFLTEEKGMNPNLIIFKYMKSYEGHLITGDYQTFLNISAESFRTGSCDTEEKSNGVCLEEDIVMGSDISLGTTNIRGTKFEPTEPDDRPVVSRNMVPVTFTAS